MSQKIEFTSTGVGATPKEFIIDTFTLSRDYWRQTPCLFRNALSPEILSNFSIEHFYSWCKPLASARFYILIKSETTLGKSKAAILPDVTQAPELFEIYSEKGEELTLLLNHIEAIAPELVVMRERFGVGLSWRYDDIVATLSTPNSGIGFHAGHEDGFIVQLQGSRDWSLWQPDILPDSYIRYLLGDTSNGDVSSPSRPLANPYLRYHLEAGDVLYLPPFFAHEGITIEESISLSIAWRGLSPCYLLTSILGNVSENVWRCIHNNPDMFFRLIPDPKVDNYNIVEFLFENLKECLQLLESEAPSDQRVRDYLHLYCQLSKG